MNEMHRSTSERMAALFQLLHSKTQAQLVELGLYDEDGKYIVDHPTSLTPLYISLISAYDNFDGTNPGALDQQIMGHIFSSTLEVKPAEVVLTDPLLPVTVINVLIDKGIINASRQIIYPDKRLIREICERLQDIMGSYEHKDEEELAEMEQALLQYARKIDLD